MHKKYFEINFNRYLQTNLQQGIQIKWKPQAKKSKVWHRASCWLRTTSAHLKILESTCLWYGIWQYVGNLTFFYYICAALCGLSFSVIMVPLIWSLRIQAQRWTSFFPLACHKTQILHQWFSYVPVTPKSSRFSFTSVAVSLVSVHSLAEYVQTSEIGWWKNCLN